MMQRIQSSPQRVPSKRIRSTSSHPHMALDRAIRSQGYQNGMSSWEIDAFIETFERGGSLSDAYRILTAYSSLQSDVSKLVHKRASYISKLVSILCSKGTETRFKGTETRFELQYIVSKIAEYSLKVWIAVCRLRQLQWSPQPITISSVSDPNSSNNFIFVFKKDIALVLDVARKNDVRFIDYDVDPMHLIVMLTTSAAESSTDPQVLKELLSSSISTNESFKSSDDINVESQMSPYRELIEVMRAVSWEEASADSTWQAFASIKSGSENMHNRADMFPVLRVQYGAVPPPSCMFSSDSPGVYCRACRVLLEFFYSKFFPLSKRANEDSHEVVVRLLLRVSTSARETSRVPLALTNERTEIPDIKRAGQKMKVYSTMRPHTSPSTRHSQKDEKVRDHDNQVPTTTQEKKKNRYSCDELTKISKSSVRDVSYETENIGEMKEQGIDKIDSQTLKQPEIENQVPSRLKINEHKALEEVSSNSHSGNASILHPYSIPSEITIEDIPHTPSTQSQPGGVVAGMEDVSTQSCKPVRPVSRPTRGSRLRSAQPSGFRRVNRQREQCVTLMLQSVASKDLLLVLERVSYKSDCNKHRILVRGFLPDCPLTTMRDCKIGDELLTVAGTSVEGRYVKDVYKALSNTTTPVRPTSAIQHPKIVVQVRRYYDNWEEYADRSDTASVTSYSRARNGTLSQVDNSDVKPLHDYENQILQLKNELKEAESNVTASDEKGFLVAKEYLLRKFDELQEVQQGYLEAKTRFHSTSDPSLTKRNTSHSVSEAVQTASSSHEMSDYSNMTPLKVSLRRSKSGKHSKTVVPPHLARANVMSSKPQRVSVEFNHCSTRVVDAAPTSHLARTQPSGYRNQYVYTQSVPTSHQQLGSCVLKPLRNTSAVVPTTLRDALHQVNRKYKAKGVRKQSAVKIAVWWKLVLPQKKLQHRLWICNLCREWIYELLDKSVEKGIRAVRLRNHMMRHGAAVKLQKQFRNWRLNVLKFYVRIQRHWKRILAQRAVRRLVTITRAATLVARYLFKRKLRLREPVGKRRLYSRVIRHFMECVGFRVRDKKQKEVFKKIESAPRHWTRNGYSMRELGRRHDIFLKRFNACLKIQSLFRMKLASVFVAEYRREVHTRRNLVVSMCGVKLCRKLHHRRRKVSAAVTLQRVWRGASSRWKLMIRVLAGIKINTCWRKYRQYWKLKRCIRRTEVPVQIVLHGVRELPANLVLSKTVKVRVSVWWASLLHLVEQDDFKTVIETKQPNIVRTTSLYECVEQPRVDPPISPLKFQNSSVPNSPVKRDINHRKLSLSQTAYILRNKESGRTKTAADKLAEFARIHGTRGANIRMGGSYDDYKLNKPGNARVKKAFQNAVKKSLIIQSASSSQDNNDQLKEEESDSDSSSSSDSESVRESHDNSGAGSLNISNDSIGRECINTLGSNLIGSVAPKSRTMLFTQPSSKDFAAASILRTTCLKPVLKTPTPKPNAMNLLSRKTLSTVFSGRSMFESYRGFDRSSHDTVVQKDVKYTVDLQDETLYIPGCHGNSVIRFDFFDGERKIGTNTFLLSSDQSLMFWGGEMTRKVDVNTTKKNVVLGKKSFPVERSRLGMSQACPLFEVRVAAGAAFRSRCGWAMVSFRGSGPMKRRNKTKGILKSLLESWDNMYISMDGEILFFYTSKSAAEPTAVLSLGQVKSIHMDLAESTGNNVNARKGTKYVEDKFVVVLTTQGRDVIHLRFQDSMARENWVRTLVYAVDYNRDSLLKKLPGNVRDHSGSQDRPRRR
eukprot:CAMPEP_0185044324 /NCGR_PEP_ID=MMETSP1103-20130426/43385_1 /TAXON_ID=36769 /ORGANISM="Paraphysomonas bandaiensis, Strain Caron Lab Isolate" /LENGTH=1760 /DNA_ID=CAMNT_0027584577 /DNA_START=146 /DNA_END=5428 /DNA_ORIENTATION=-